MIDPSAAAAVNFHRLFQDNPVPMWIVDCETMHFLAVNRAAATHYGYSEEEFLGMTFLDIRPAEERDLARDFVNVREDFRRRFIHQKKNGERIVVEVTAHQTLFGDRPARAVVLNDITERTRAEEALRASEERLRLITETIQEVFWMSDPAYTRYYYLSPGFERVWRQPRAAVMENARAFAHTVHPDDRARVLRVHDNLKNGQPYEHEYRICWPDGTVRWIYARGFPVRNAAGEVESYVGVAQDITERKALELQVQRFQRTESVGRLATGIAHDMNNVLAPILMGAPLLRAGLPAEEAEKMLSAIEVSAQRGAALVRQLLIYGRGIEGAPHAIDPRAVIAEVATMCGQTFPRNITLVTPALEDVRPVQADPTQLQQVILNLAVNARDAMPNGGRLEISADNADVDDSYAARHKDARPGRYVRIRVTDTGTGIPPELAEQIFDPYFTTKEDGKGTGLGLSSALGIVKSHGGFIRLHSELGRGTTFTVYLPASTAAVAAPTAGPAAPTQEHGRGELVMIVDDDEGIRRVLRETLVKYGYRVLSASDGVEATAVFAANSGVALVLTDLDMPLVDGVNLARVLRRMKPTVRIVLSTGFEGRSGRALRTTNLDALGIHDVLEKPYTAERLLNVLRAALQADAPVV